LTPADLVKAYGLPKNAGDGQTVAIVDAYNDPNIEADLQVFDAQYGLAPCTVANKCLRIVGQKGGTQSLPANDTSGWSVEETLDVETVHAICPKCKIALVEANSNSFADLGTAVNSAVRNGATVVSNSYGGTEFSDPAIEAAYDHPGVVIVASTGDDGFYSYDFFAGTSAPNTPAVLPTVVSVGGTSLFLGQAGARQNETVWNDNGPKDEFQLLSGDRLGAGGGGCSLIYNAPAWQTAVHGWKATACGTKRLSADVAAVGDYLTGFDIYDSYSCASGCVTGWHTFGGTSLAAPLIGAVYALAGGAQGVDYPASILYDNYGKAYDVTTGGNGYCAGQGAAGCGNPNNSGYGVIDCAYTADGSVNTGNAACDAKDGFDGPTGVGTPLGIAAFKNTVAQRPSPSHASGK
jgi:subtilase family serine protease